jgi:AAHS family 3-hydroxyphenylpropionic acid transporter
MKRAGGRALTVRSETTVRSGVTVAICFLAALVEGYDVQSMGVAAPTMGPALDLTREQLGPVFSASIFGLLIGAAFGGRIADMIGRKWTLAVSLAVFGGFTLATVYAADLNALLLIRVAAGLGLGGAMPNMLALAAENTSSARRAMMTTIMAAGMPFGGAIAGAVGAVAEWREIFFVGGWAPLLLAPIVAFVMKESPEFVESRATGKDKGGGVLALFKGGTALTTILLWVGLFFTLLTLYLLLNWLPTLMASKGADPRNASLISLLFNTGGGIGTILLSFALDRARRATMAVSFLGMAATLLWLNFAGGDVVSAGAAAFGAGFFVIGGQLALYGLGAELYPTAIRGTGLGAALAAGRFGAFAGPLLASDILARGGDAQAVLLALLPAVALGAVATLWLCTRPKPA